MLIVKPMHPAFKGKARVRRSDIHADEGVNYYIVNLNTLTCDCPWGSPTYVWSDENGNKTLPNHYCVHKLKAMGILVEKNPEELMWPYIKALATRYNVYEVVSAFHKELRRGDFTKAYYWASILSTFRGLKGVIKYMLNIIYEETRDHELHKYLITIYGKALANTATSEHMCKAVQLFCDSKKKWQLGDRLAIFEDEMKGYRRLSDKYTPRVAEGCNIISANHHDTLKQAMLEGYATKDRELVQYGLKGLFKSKALPGGDHVSHKVLMYGLLVDLLNGDYPNKFDFNKEDAHALIEVLELRIAMLRNGKKDCGFGYHELNALADILCGESFHAGNTTRIARKKITRSKSLPTLRLGYIVNIPLYAHDNHTWGGKHLMKKHAHELKPGAVQKHLDFRLCGAYFGVAWRYLAFQQFGTTEVKWGDVKWPAALYKQVARMFY